MPNLRGDFDEFSDNNEKVMKMRPKIVPDSYARRKYNGALAEETQNRSGKDEWPCKITISINTSKDMAPERWWNKPKA